MQNRDASPMVWCNVPVSVEWHAFTAHRVVSLSVRRPRDCSAQAGRQLACTKAAGTWGWLYLFHVHGRASWCQMMGSSQLLKTILSAHQLSKTSVVIKSSCASAHQSPAILLLSCPKFSLPMPSLDGLGRRVSLRSLQSLEPQFFGAKAHQINTKHIQASLPSAVVSFSSVDLGWLE